jgi:hypothetical protein
MRWLNEEKWDADIQHAASAHNVPANLIRAIIATESQFRPGAKRDEVKIGDASIGLMQILTATARGEGYTGDVGDPAALSGLYDPATNVFFGASYLATQYRRASSDPARTFSAYNGGWRPELGFGTRATRETTICLARDAKGNCIKTRVVRPGEFGNQPYVDAALANLNYFQAKPGPGSGTTSPLPRPVSNEPQTDGRVNGATDRVTGPSFWEALIAFLRSWFK